MRKDLIFMKKSIKCIISMVMVIAMVMAISVTAFAASGFHKVNGCASETGQSRQYTSTTTAYCSKITAQGTSDNNSKQVIVVIQSSSGKVVYSGTVTLNGIEKPLVSFYTASLSPDTYTITVTSSDTVGYEVSTYFYQ